MGQVYLGKCNNCGYQKTFFLGQSRFDESLRHISKLFGEEVREEIMDMYHYNMILTFSVKREISVFSNHNNGDLFVNTTLEIKDKKGGEHIYSKFQKDEEEKVMTYSGMDLLGVDIVPCPKCKESFINFSIIGNWE